MEKKVTPNEIKIWLGEKFVSLLLNDDFRLHDNEIQVLFAEFKAIHTHQLTEQDHTDILHFIKNGFEQSEQLLFQFFKTKKDEIEPLYTLEFNHYYVEIDINTCQLNSTEKHLPILEFDMRFECMNTKNEPIFMYDSRGLCHVEFQVNTKKQLIVKEVS